MYFLANWLGDAIGHKIEEILRSVMLLISTLFYELIIFFYDIFVRLGTAEILTSSQVEQIYSRVTLILGIFMLFKMLFSFIQYLLNPEQMSDKSKGAAKIVLKAVVVVALLGTCPFIFQQAFKLQNAVLESNILGKLILADENAGEDVSEFGAELSSYLFFSFYSLYEGETCEEAGDDLEDLRDEIIYNHSFTLAKECVNAEPMNKKHDFAINYAGNGLLSLGVSIFVLYIILSYCLSVGMRVIQLAFLQLIAPIPIISYLGEDKDGAFSKWVKRCISTFIDLFIRMGIIYFVVYIINLVMNSNSDSYNLLLSTTGDPTGKTKFWLIVIIILGLLMFAKKAPDLLKEVLPQGIGGNDYGIGWKSFKDKVSPLAAAASLAGGVAARGGLALVGNTGAAITRGKKALRKANDGYKFGRDINGNRVYGKFDDDGNLIAGSVLQKGSAKYNERMDARKAAIKRSLLGGAGTIAAQTALGTIKGFGTSTKGNALKNIGGAAKKQIGYNNRFRRAVDQGSTFKGRVGEHIANFTGYEGVNTAAYNESLVAEWKNEKTRLNANKVVYDRFATNRSTVYDSANSSLKTDTFKSSECIEAQRKYQLINSIVNQAQNTGKVSLADLTEAHTLATSLGLDTGASGLGLDDLISSAKISAKRNQTVKFSADISKSIDKITKIKGISDDDKRSLKDIFNKANLSGGISGEQLEQLQAYANKYGIDSSVFDSNLKSSAFDDSNFMDYQLQNTSSLGSSLQAILNKQEDTSTKAIANYRLKLTDPKADDYDVKTATARANMEDLINNYSDIIYEVTEGKGLDITDYSSINDARKVAQDKAAKLSTEISNLQTYIDNYEQSDQKWRADANREAAHPIEGGLKGGVSRAYGPPPGGPHGGPHGGGPGPGPWGGPR